MHSVWKDRAPPRPGQTAGITFPRGLGPGRDTRRRNGCRSWFEDEIYPVLTPLAVDPAHPFPSLLNKSLNLAVLLLDPTRRTRNMHRDGRGPGPTRPAPPAPASGQPADAHDGRLRLRVHGRRRCKEHLDALFPGLHGPALLFVPGDPRQQPRPTTKRSRAPTSVKALEQASLKSVGAAASRSASRSAAAPIRRSLRPLPGGVRAGAAPTSTSATARSTSAD